MPRVLQSSVSSVAGCSSCATLTIIVDDGVEHEFVKVDDQVADECYEEYVEVRRRGTTNAHEDRVKYESTMSTRYTK